MESIIFQLTCSGLPWSFVYHSVYFFLKKKTKTNKKKPKKKHVSPLKNKVITEVLVEKFGVTIWNKHINICLQGNKKSDEKAGKS